MALENNVVEGHTDILHIISDDKLPILRDIFITKWPYACQTYFFIDNIITWKKKIPGLNVTFYSPYGNWQNGTFLTILNEWNYKIFFYTLNKDSKELMDAIRTTDKINWKRGPYFIDIHEELIDNVMKLLPDINTPVTYVLESACWWLPKEKAINFEINCPPEFYTAALKPEDSIFINSQWPSVHTFPGSEKFLAKIIETNGGLGLFTRSSNELKSWILVNDFAALSVLQTVEEHKRRGYASIVVKQLAKNRALLKEDSIACILRDNSISEAFFGKLGFIKLHNLRCIQFKKETKFSVA